MDTELSIQKAEGLVQGWAQRAERPAPERLEVWLATEDLLAAVRAVVDDEWGYLAAITGLDLGVEEGQIEVLYHFCRGAAVLGLRVLTPREAAMVPSVCPVIPSAGFYERELSEMLGVTVAGTPDPARLFLPDEWPAGVYPLRKDFKNGDQGLTD